MRPCSSWRHTWAMLTMSLFMAAAAGCSAPAPSQQPAPPAGEGTGSQPAPEQPQRGGSLTIATPGQPLSLDSRINMGTDGGLAAYQAQEGLLTTDPKTGQPGPGLAEKWDVSPDGLTYTFQLRQGVKFHDGTDFDADDVRFTFEFLTGARKGGAYVSQFGPFIKAVETPDKRTVIIRLNSPWEDFTTFLHRNWATLILSKDAVEAAGDKYGVDNMVGTGPFKLKSITKGDSVTLERNPNYWQQGLPYLDGMTFKTVKDGTVRLLNARTGAADIVYDPPVEQIPTIKGEKSLKIVSRSGNPMISIQVNTTVAPFNSKAARQALYFGLNREELVQNQYGEYAVVARHLFPSWHWMYDPNFKGVEYNPEKAKQLLTEAGHGPNSPLKFSLVIDQDGDSNGLGVLMQAQLKKIGVQMDLKPMESATRLALMAGQNGLNRDDYKATLFLQNLPGSGTDDYMFKFYGGKGILNRVYYNRPGGFQNPAVDTLIDQARSAPDRESARKLYHQAVTQIMDDAPLIPLAFLQNVNLVNAKVQDYYPQGTNVIHLTHVWVKR